MKRDNGLYWLAVTIVVFVVDIASKFWMMQHFFLFESVNVLPFFSITYVQNIGAAFSIFEGQRWMLSAIAIVIILVIVYLLAKNTRSKKLENLSLSLILGGALGNLFDRLYHGFVVDFLDVNFGHWHYPTFNFADCAICIGIAFFVFTSYKTKKN